MLGRTIVIGEYCNSPFPREADTVRHHGVSHSVTHEAVKMLVATGLVGAPQAGKVVRPLEVWNLFDTDVPRWLPERRRSLTLLRQLNELRVAVESQAAALAAETATSEQRAAITAGLDRMRAADFGDDDALEADIAFHLAILRGSSNQFIVQLRSVVATALRTSPRFTNRVDGRTTSIADHAAVHEAILARGPDGARAAMTALIDRVLAVIVMAPSSEEEA